MNDNSNKTQNITKLNTYIKDLVFDCNLNLNDVPDIARFIDHMENSKIESSIIFRVPIYSKPYDYIDELEEIIIHFIELKDAIINFVNKRRTY